jgi:hypothetical protein
MTRLSDIQEQSTDPDNAPAIVQGSEGRGVALFHADRYGDIVDITYLCIVDSWNDSRADGALEWPCFDFGDFGAYCEECGDVIEAARA